jgi:hypothetical protein
MTYLPSPFEHSLQRWRRLDRVVRLVIANWALGMAVGATCAGVWLGLDIIGLRSLLWRSDIAVVGTAAFVALFALTFGGVVAATAVMRASDDDDESHGGLRAPTPRAPVLAYARSSR